MRRYLRLGGARGPTIGSAPVPQESPPLPASAPRRRAGVGAPSAVARGRPRGAQRDASVSPCLASATIILCADSVDAAGSRDVLATAASAGPVGRWRWLIRPTLALLVSLLLLPVSGPYRNGGMQASGGGTGPGSVVPGAPPDVAATPRYDPGGAGPAGPPSAARRSRQERGGVFSVSKVYANVNVERPPSYWDYDSMNIHWGYVVCAVGWACSFVR